MRKLNIYLQFPWKWTDSPYYKYLREKPPFNIKYVNSNDFKLIQNRRELKIKNWVKRSIKKTIKKIYPSMPNIHWTNNAKKYDLIHCGHCLSLNKQPWICDIEYVGQFWASPLRHKFYSSKIKVRKYLQSKYCKKILAWTEWSKNGIIKEFPEIRNKVEVIYPAIPLPKIKKEKKNKITLLFVGRDFELKGGGLALPIIDNLVKKHNKVEAIVVSDVPKKILNKYKKNKKIKFYDLMSHERLFDEIYPNSDIFIYPTFSDTFGFAIIEAQSFGLPVVSMKTASTHTIQETISERKTGFVIKNLISNSSNRVASKKVIDALTKKIEELIINDKLRTKMSRACRSVIRDGKFSIKVRNKKFAEVYSRAVK